MKICYYSMTDKGISRDHNEDFFINDPKYSIFMVADGMGGYEAGDLASKMALNSIITYLNQSTDGSGEFSERAFIHGVDYANACVFNHKSSNPDIKNMGTTFVSFNPSNDGAFAFHIGDSRVYQLRNKELKQITKDHSAEQEVLPDFMQNANEGKYSSVLTRALGTNEKVQTEVTPIDLLNSDVYLICSDGLYSMIEDKDMQSILTKQNSIKEKCQELVDKANENGGEDNITVTLVEILSIEDQSICSPSICE